LTARLGSEFWVDSLLAAFGMTSMTLMTAARAAGAAISRIDNMAGASTQILTPIGFRAT
jgi:hypothetical protein